jgi:hypothetical protein
MPLRHWLYPGDVSWNEEGHRFSWHMKLRTKTARAVFHATDAQGNELDSFTKPEQVLHRRQLELLGERPDFVLQYAKWIAEELRQQGHEGVQVRANVMAMLNGRRPQLLVDPTVDLVATPRTLRHNTWIMPLTEPIPTLAQLRERRAAAAAMRRQQQQALQQQQSTAPLESEQTPRAELEE